MKAIPESDVLLHASIAEWDKFLATDKAPSGQNIYPNVFHNGILFPLQRMRETEAMIKLARMFNPRVVMEIGSDKGGSFYHWVKGFTPAKAIAVELRGIPFADSFPKAFPDTRFYFVDDSSYTLGTIAKVKAFLGEDTIDCLFIDGDKGGFVKDVQAYMPMMRKGGLMLLHDVQDVVNAQDAMRWAQKHGHRTQVILDTSEYDEIAARERAEFPPADSYEGWFRTWKRTSCGVGVIHV